MDNPVLSGYKLTVNFDVDKLNRNEDPVTIEGPFTPPTSKDLLIKPGIALIVLELVTLHRAEGGPAAEFPTYPIEWFDWLEDGAGTRATSQPECFQVQRFSETRCTIVDYNTTLHWSGSSSHPFNVAVSYNNKTYGSDPTIVNEPEDG